MIDVYPYVTSADRHPYSWVFFNAGGISVDIETAEALAKHVFDDLGCGKPGSASDPVVKYDALGGSGGPWEPGAWIPMDEPRMSVSISAPHIDIGRMSEAERANLRAMLDAADAARRAGVLSGHGDEMGGGAASGGESVRGDSGKSEPADGPAVGAAEG